MAAGSKTGYVRAAYLSGTKVSPPTEPKGPANGSSNGSGTATVQKYVNVSSGTLNMRTAPSLTASIIAYLAKGTIVQVTSEQNGWAKIIASGKTGYVSAEFLASTAPSPAGSTILKNYQSYAITLNDMLNVQLQANPLPQTDKKYSTYIRSDALIVNSKTNPAKGVVIDGTWNVRGGAGTDYWTIGKLAAGSMVNIYSSVKGKDGKTWYQISYNKTWVNASPEDVKYYLDPKNFESDPVQSFQFLKLTETANVNKDEINKKILAGKGILAGKAESFLLAAKLSGVNEIYLISHALLETWNGTSQLAEGVLYKGRTVYNMYGVGANDSSAVESGAAFAYKAGWFTPEAAIIGGAKFIESNYLQRGQDTLYKMRWNQAGVANAKNRSATNQYATDIGWASKQVVTIYKLYSLLDSRKVKLDIPKYQ
ncbi:Bifunctional autolysin Atl [Heyndrickxia coagulans]|uniref:Bifunctional autolysin Atl n=1 Tax=Heyndrickxia coagulans TaxID=1398 RepID=A0A150JYS0_HEYCO|nr:Bifunctional autolysin Atl [Heyndrickxia coagulans]